MAKEIKWYDTVLAFIMIIGGLNWLPVLLKSLTGGVIDYSWDLVALLASVTHHYVGLILYFLVVFSTIWWLAILIDMLVEGNSRRR